jgi:PAS domain S-box-containing protein
MDENKAHLRLRKRVLRLVEALPGHGWVASAEGHMVYASKSLEDMLVGTDVTSLLPNLSSSKPNAGYPHEYDELASRWHKSITTGCEYEINQQILWTDGKFRWIKSTAKPVRDRSGSILYWLGVSVDIDSTIRAAERAQLNEQQLRTLLDTIPAPIWSADESGRPIYSNREHLRQTGRSISRLRDPAIEPVAGSMSFLVHPDDRGLIEGDVRNSFRTGTPINVKYRKLLSNGTYRWVNNKAEAFRDESGKIVGWYGVSFDIDDEVRLQKDLIEREAQLRRVVDTLPALIWTSDASGNPTYLNKRFQEHTGTSISELASGDHQRMLLVTDLIHPEDRVAAAKSLCAALAAGNHWTGRFRFKQSDGGHRWTELRMAPFHNQSGEIGHWYGMALDVDDEFKTRADLKESQERLRQAIQIASMAELSAAIAHEISQPLAALIADTEASHRWLAMQTPNVERCRNSLESVLSHAQRVLAVIDRVRKLFRQTPSQRHESDINNILMKVIKLAAEEPKIAKVKISAELDRDLPHIEVDAIEIQQVVLNLIRNSAEAMETANLEDRVVRVQTDQHDGKVVVSVADNGPGLSNVHDVFDPFMTTKQNGMGIGLTISRSIVAGYGGMLWAENTDAGAKFSFDIPMTPPT